MIERSKVLWLGGPPSPADQQEHAHRGLALCEVGSDALAHDAMDLTHARGLVLNAVPPHVPRVVQALGCVAAALSHGLHVLVLLADSVAHAWVQEKLEQVVAAGPARDRVRYRIAATAPEIAEAFARCDPGPAINRALTIQTPDGLELTLQQIFLLQRAFYDCTLIALTPLPGGRSAMTMLVQATLANSMAGLHAENVRVRGDDAIIIDLARVALGPPSADPACLEVWIAFELPPPDVQVDESEWLSMVQRLYAPPLLNSPEPEEGPASMSWLRDSVAQIRRLAFANSAPSEYAISLALYLLRRAMYEPDPQAPELDRRRRTWAWILGCQLLEAIQATESCYQEAA